MIMEIPRLFKSIRINLSEWKKPYNGKTLENERDHKLIKSVTCYTEELKEMEIRGNK